MGARGARHKVDYFQHVSVLKTGLVSDDVGSLDSRKSRSIFVLFYFYGSAVIILIKRSLSLQKFKMHKF